MTIIYNAPKPPDPPKSHVCSFPSKGLHYAGTIFRCDECEIYYILEHHWFEDFGEGGHGFWEQVWCHISTRKAARKLKDLGVFK